MINNLFKKFASEEDINIEGIDFRIRELVCTYEPGVYILELVAFTKIPSEYVNNEA